MIDFDLLYLRNIDGNAVDIISIESGKEEYNQGLAAIKYKTRHDEIKTTFVNEEDFRHRTELIKSSLYTQRELRFRQTK